MRIWTKHGDGWRGYGNGHKAFLYPLRYSDNVTVRVYKGDICVAIENKIGIPAAKRWAERHYLKGTSK